MKLYPIFKRIIDVVVSLIGIITLSPVFLIIAILVKTTSKGPIIYEHQRIGKNGKQFNIYKFRSMIVGARNLQKKGISKDKLVTPIGRITRKIFLDETLQLFNVLKSDMSLIGPRPFDERGTYDKHKELYKIRPGMTGMGQVEHYLPKKEIKKFEEHFQDLLKEYNEKELLTSRLPWDSYYLKHMSFLLDMKIIFYTIFLIFEKIFSK